MLDVKNTFMSLIVFQHPKHPVSLCMVIHAIGWFATFAWLASTCTCQFGSGACDNILHLHALCSGACAGGVVPDTTTM